jgi:glutaredoxin
MEHVPGKNMGKLTLYALSTCGWCRRTKDLLNELGVEYDFVYVDKLEGTERENAIETVKKWNPSSSFPLLVINDEKCIVGFREDQIRESLKL